MTEEYYIGQVFEEMYPKEASDWANANNADIIEIDPIEKDVEEKYETIVPVENEIVIPATEDEPEHTETVTENQIQEQTQIVTKTVRRFEIVEKQTPTPTYEEQKQNRANAYQLDVDPITSHIERLRDEEQTEETVAKINELIAERAVKVEEIKARYPYPVEEDNGEEEVAGSAEQEEIS